MKKKIEKILAYKAFNKDMKCRGFQYKEGETYKHDGRVVPCESGFNSCENPIDIFKYYNPGISVFHVVEASGEIARHEEDSKVASSEIKIGVAINLHDLIGASVNFMFARKYIKETSKHSTGDRSASSATGYRSASSATGNRSASSATGFGSASSATGYSSASSATGDRSASSATGYSSASSATGYSSASSATGNRSASSATGDRSASSATGYSSASVCTGLNSKAMAGKYGCISLAWWNKKEERGEMRCAETGCGDGSDGKLKAEVFYSLDVHGNFVEEK